jgi:hypothetical protein
VFKFLLGIAPIVGIFTTLGKLMALERRMAMSLIKYLADRDQFIVTEVYREFRDKVNRNIISDDRDCVNLVRAAISRAAEEWKAATDENIQRQLEQIDIPTPQ